MSGGFMDLTDMRASNRRPIVSLLEFYLLQTRYCDDAARVSTDLKIIDALKKEGARYRSLATALQEDPHGANENDPYERARKSRDKPWSETITTGAALRAR